jgi:hypothetical protein
MFDLDGNGNLDIGEFEQLQTIIRNQTSSGQRHRDTRMTGSVLKGNSTLNEYFFGPDCDQLLTVKKFTDFQKQLQAECIQKEVGFIHNLFEKVNILYKLYFISLKLEKQLLESLMDNKSYLCHPLVKCFWHMLAIIQQRSKKCSSVYPNPKNTPRR